MNEQKRYCVIGAGVAGVCAAKYALQVGGDVVVYEQTDQVGGTWVYTDATGKDKHGLDIHSSMYQGLWTNLPKEIMGFPDYEMPQQQRSYIHSSEVLQFVKDYASHFDVTRHTQFEHLVEEVRPCSDGRWQVTVKDLNTTRVSVAIFDYVFVCNGHYFNPDTPTIAGKEKFRGIQLHSHYYRNPEIFKQKHVLIIGSGPSGKDLVFAAAKNATQVYFSHHVPEKLKQIKFPDNVTQVPDVAEMFESEVEFTDRRRFSIDMVLYCTGYRYQFPFLHADCGIEVDENWVKPLFKHVININHPTMAFIGIPYHVCTTLMFDVQVRFALKYYTQGKPLPSKQELMLDYETEMSDRWKRGLKKRQAHMMGGEIQRMYYDDLAQTAEITPVPPVMTRMHIASARRKLEDLDRYRNDVFRVLDEYNFEITYDEKLAVRA